MRSKRTPYIIAEIGCNHNGDLDLARQMILEAKKCGCDAFKIQLWNKSELFTNQYLHDLNDGKISLENVKEWKTKELGLNDIFAQVDRFSIYKKEHVELFKFARKAGIDYASTAVTEEGVDFLIDQKVAFIKIASMDTNNPVFLEYVFSKNYPVVVSLGMASLGEIEEIVRIIPEKNKKNVTLLHCVSLYPPDDAIVHLKFIQTLKRLFDINIGYSDHTLGFSIPLAAVALGASVIEKHFTLDKGMPGWDHKVSADPQEMKIICSESKRITAALGTEQRMLSEEEIQKRLKFRRSLIIARPVKKGNKIARADLTYKRPGTGISPAEMKFVLGRTAGRNLEPDQLLEWKDLV